MIDKENNHCFEYFILVIGLGVAFSIFYLFRYDIHIKLATSFSGSLFYVLWGIIHHAMEGRLTKNVFLEYLLIGIFVFSLLAIAIMY